ncbi:hypothetical protein [Aeoliella sp.]|uniref:flagellin N-terminal helical domain-containing protein n=1 Tax=Aeoliella sp. TaxID=2795800 RepID=UPI003CCBC7F7
MAILPIPTTRVSDLLATRRITQQVQSDQLDLLRAQTQISTGRRIISPSDDAPASLRAMNLQRILERKLQTQTSLRDSVLFLSEAEKSVNEVSNILNSIKSEALAVDSTLTTEEERLSVVRLIDRAMEQLVNIGNSQFRDRYLFAGSRSQSQPYDYDDTFISYNGNEDHLRSFVDVGFLYETNIPGSEVFGGISEQVLGSVDLNPQVTRDTQVQHLNGGAGISSGAVEIFYVNASNQATSSVVDLSNAATIDDVARYLQSGVPEGSNITVEVTGTGLQLSTATGAEGVFVREVGEGRVAHDLGIRSSTPQSTLTGDDVTPAVLKTTRLEDLLGTKAQTSVTSAGDNNDFFVTATQNGAAAGTDPLNGVTIQFLDGATAGSELATYDDVAGTLTVTIEAGVSTAAQVVDAINAEANGLFSAEVDYRDSTSSTSAGLGVVALSSTAVTAGGSGDVLDQTSGLMVTNGDQSVTVDISTAETVEELLNILNQDDLGLQVEINEAGTGINIRSRLSGADLTIGEVAGGQTATQLGVRTLTGATLLEDFNRGGGVPNGLGQWASSTNEGLEITVNDVANVDNDGTSFFVDLTGAITVDDVINLINNHTDNTSLVTADLAPDGNGIRLTDISGLPNDLTVRSQGTYNAAELLGFVAEGESEARSSTGTLVSEDRHTLETDSVFNTLLRLREALVDENYTAIGREINQIETDLDRVNFARSELGARLQSLETLQYRHEDEEVALRSALSNEIDVDLTEAISDFTARQYALQASLQVAGNMLQMSLLNFI